MSLLNFFRPPPAPSPWPLLARPANAVPDWTEQQRLEWDRFLATATGRQLIERCAALEYALLQGAAQSGAPADLQNAAGWRQCRLWLESLSRPASARTAEANDKPRPGDPDALEQFTP